MRFFQVVLSGAALIAAALALELNDVPSSIEPGKTYTITYSPKTNTPTTLKLRKGDPNNLKDIAVLTTTATNGAFQWTVDNALTNAKDYAIEISQAGADPNYSGLISLSGGSDASSAASSPSATPSASKTDSATAKSSTGAAASTTLSTTATAASASISSTAGSNTTISSATLSRSATGSGSQATGSGSPTSSGGAPANTGAASTLASSPLALIFGAVAALAYLN